MTTDPADARERLGMMGGTFDPPHLAHLALAAAARSELRLDRVVFVPAGKPWRKGELDVNPGAARMEMLRAAIAPFDWAEASAVELDREGPTYTSETLEVLAQPGQAWWFICGADALADMPHWHNPRRLVELARLAVAQRLGVDGPLIPPELRSLIPHVEEHIDLIDLPPLAISSTEIRERVRDGRSTEYLLPAAVREVIDRLGLYRD